MNVQALDNNHIGRAIFVLTKDRPEQLHIVLTEILSATYNYLPIFVLDGSNYLLPFDDGVKRLMRGRSSRLARVNVQSVIRDLRTMLPATQFLLRSDSAPIARSRNLGLIIAAGLGLNHLCFVDDDMVNFGQTSVFNCFLTQRDAGSCNQIIGVEIGGADSRDQLSLLATVAGNLAAQDCPTTSTNDDLLIRKGKGQRPTVELANEGAPIGVEHISGGFAVCHLKRDKVLPFPSVYNEFWIWCFLQNLIYGTSIKQAPESVCHRPPAPAGATAALIVREQMGILFYRVLRAYRAELSTTRDGIYGLCPPFNMGLVRPSQRVGRHLERIKKAGDAAFRGACEILCIPEHELGRKLIDILDGIDTRELTNKLFGEYKRDVVDFDAVCLKVRESGNFVSCVNANSVVV